MNWLPRNGYSGIHYFVISSHRVCCAHCLRLGIPDIVGSADPNLIRAVLDNLIGNAWKYTAHRPDPKIEFGVTEIPGDPVTYFVTDNGAGFDSAHAGKLFQPFQRLHGAEFPGTGIGLVSVLRIIERHGGRVWAEAVVDRGVTFFFTLNEREKVP